MTHQLSFFNSIHLSGTELSEATGKAVKQDDRVYGLFVTYGKMTPLECSRIYNENYPPCPPTSIRRSITVLTKKGKLQKLDEMTEEKYGSRNHYWKIKP